MDYRLKIAVCDECPEDLRRISDMAEKMLSEEKIDCEITCFSSAEELLSAIGKGNSFHVILLEAVFKEIGGIQLALQIRKMNPDISVVFVSFDRETALSGYEVQAVRYLAKPVETEKLREALVFCYRKVRPIKNILLPTANGTRKLSFSEIVYIETWGRGVRVRLTGGEEVAGMKISDLAAVLPQNQFALCHRTVLVNLAFVKYLRYCELEMKTGSVLPVSKYRLNDIREKLLNYSEN